MPAYSTTDFLNSVRQRGALPTTSNANNVNNTTNLLALATEELHIKLLPLIMSTREEFYVSKKDYAITAGQANYQIPTRASGLVLRDVQVISGTGIYSLPAIDPEVVSTTAQGAVQAFYLEHNNVVLYPTPGATTDTLRLRYYIRPSRLAATTDCAQISAIDTDTLTVTVNAVPSSWTTNTVVDFISANVPYQCRAIDQVVINTGTGTLTFAALPTDLAVGDWVALAEYTPIPQLPQEFQAVLAQMTVVKALESLGDQNGVTAAMRDLQVIEKAALQLVTPRNHGEQRKVVNRNWRR